MSTAPQTSVGNLAFQEGITNFSLSLYSTAVGKSVGNEFISPFSISAALLMLSLGTGGKTRYQLLSTLFAKRELKNIHTTYRNLEKDLASRMTKGVTLSLANRLFIGHNFRVRESFIDYTRKYYGSGIDRLNFGNSEQSRTKINTWIASKTNQKILNMLPRGIINSMTVIVIANAIYFKGTWATQFDPKNTKKRNFLVGENEQKQIDMMFGEFPALSGLHADLGCKILQLPYSGDKLSMVFILPNVGNTLSKIEKGINVSKLNLLLSGLRKRETIIGIPKFKIEAEYDLKPILEILGITEIFDDKVADFTNMVSQRGLPVYVSDARHKAYVEVNEQGSEAAAATTVVVSARSGQTRPRKKFQFIADRPFMFIIRDDVSGTILFIGKYVAP